MHNPTDQRGFLRQTQQTVPALATEEELEEWREARGQYYMLWNTLYIDAACNSFEPRNSP